VLFAGSIDLQSLKVETVPRIPERKSKRRIKPVKTSRTPRPMIMEKIKAEIGPEEEKPGESPAKTKTEERKPKVPVKSMANNKIEEIPSQASLKVKGRPADKTPRKPTPQKDKKIKDSSFVKKRLQSLKRKYVGDIEGIDEVIEERLTPIKGVLGKMRSTIIWSFDALDVQNTMQDILTGAKESIILMYPWIRNLDVSILKKCMDTKSKLIIQEASLDDEASVELIKLLMDNNVDVRTMPHVHTVAAVVDDKKGLIISTDPIYDSFEVGVIYNDKRSIKEIEKLFEKAWSLSKQIPIRGGNQ